MLIFYSVKYHPDGNNRPEIERVLGMLESLGHKTYCVVRDLEKWGQVSLGERELMRLTLESIRNSHLLLVDLREKGVGLGLEAGYAHARGIRVAVMAPTGQEISPTLRGIAQIWRNYGSEEELRLFLAALDH